MSVATPALVEEVRALLAETLQVEVTSPDVDLVAGGLVDSLGVVELLAAMESRFGVVIELAGLELSQVRTVSSLAGLVAALQADAQAGARLH